MFDRLFSLTWRIIGKIFSYELIVATLGDEYGVNLPSSYFLAPVFTFKCLLKVPGC